MDYDNPLLQFVLRQGFKTSNQVSLQEHWKRCIYATWAVQHESHFPSVMGAAQAEVRNMRQSSRLDLLSTAQKCVSQALDHKTCQRIEHAAVRNGKTLDSRCLCLEAVGFNKFRRLNHAWSASFLCPGHKSHRDVPLHKGRIPDHELDNRTTGWLVPTVW